MLRRRTVLRVSLAAVAGGLVVAWASPVQATEYRYWSYWLAEEGSWSYANVGPAFRVPADGTVEGWRFAINRDGGGAAPRYAPDFESVCAQTEPMEDTKRVAVIVDPGLDEDAPDGQSAPGMWALCVSAPVKASGYDVLRAAATVRVDKGFICAVNSYPAAECAVVIDEPEPKPDPQPKPEPEPEPTPSPKPSRTPKPEPQTSSPSTPAESPSSSSESASESPAEVSESATPAQSSTPSATAPTPSSPTAAPATTPSVEPTPTMSMLAEPLPAQPDEGGSGSALMTGMAVGGIAILGGAAVVAARRRSL